MRKETGLQTSSEGFLSLQFSFRQHYLVAKAGTLILKMGFKNDFRSHIFHDTNFPEVDLSVESS